MLYSRGPPATRRAATIPPHPGAGRTWSLRAPGGLGVLVLVFGWISPGPPPGTLVDSRAGPATIDRAKASFYPVRQALHSLRTEIH